MYAGKEGLRVYIGFIYYLSEHSQSEELKQEFLKVLATTDNPISPVLGYASFYLQGHLMEAAEHRVSRSWWQWIKEELFRRRSTWIGNNLVLATEHIQSSQTELHKILQQYGSYFLKEKRGLYTFDYKRHQLPMALCSRILFLTAKIGVKKPQ
jgi:hypothetical protein